MTLELANKRWVTSRARVAAARVRAAYRQDLSELLRDPSLAEEPRRLLQVLRNPAYVFDFEKLVDLFASDVIPSQIVRGRSDLAVYFSPAIIPILGVA